MIKKWVILFFILLLLLLLIAGGGMVYFNTKFPVSAPIENIKVYATPQRLLRGEYLVKHVVGCIDCHSKRDYNYYSGPVIERTMGMGGFEFNHQFIGVPGNIYAKNITPAAIGNYTDGELLRVITTGITKQGAALFPLMPYLHYGNGVYREDLYSIIAYLRTLQPIEHNVPDRKLNFLMNFIVNTIPAMAAIPDQMPLKSDTIAYGKYLANAAACIDCHSPFAKGKVEQGMEYAGGLTFTFPNGDKVTSTNITPDVETGIGVLTKQNFIAKFKAFDNQTAKNIKVINHSKNTVMPWTTLAGMTEEDIGAIYIYLHSLKPIKNNVLIFEAAR